MSARYVFLVCVGACALLVTGTAHGQVVPDPPKTSDERAIFGHVRQEDIETGLWTVDQLREAGRRLFIARFTTLDGVCRPTSTGNTLPQRRARLGQDDFSRTGGPDANSCVSCHNSPDVGGAGDFTTNVFVGLGELARPQNSIAASFSNERGTPDLHGLGVVEMLAREISRTLQETRDEAIQAVMQSGESQRRKLTAKGIDFGAITATADGRLLFDDVEGIDHDLVVRPFGQKGTIASIREFTINAANLHHGMQASERFGAEQTGSDDFDEDGVADELTEGDITALCVFQATLNLPGQVLPADPRERDLIDKGEELFSRIKCASCHTPELTIDSPLFTEPGPFNVRGTLCEADGRNTLIVNLSEDGPGPRLSPQSDGRIVVRVFSDFKRHVIADNDRPHWANETVVQRRLPTNTFLTRRLWATGSTSPYGHRGDVTTIAQAIRHHGGEATESRKMFESLEADDQRAIILFLNSLCILPEGSAPTVTAAPLDQLPYVRSEDPLQVRTGTD